MYCGFWHCEGNLRAKNKEGITWGIYKELNSDCKACEKECILDNNCQSLECDYFDKRPCIWWKDLSCNVDGGDYQGQNQKIYSEQYKTCIKGSKGSDLV